MALSAQTYQGDGSNTDFVLDFTLGYISESHIHVYVDDAEIPQNTLQFILGGGSVRLPTPPASGSEVLVRRIVPNDKLLHDYENGSLVIESNLDESNLQSIMLQHEAVDGFSTGIYGDINFFTEISDSPEDTAESPRGVEQVTITGLASLAEEQRDEFETTFNAQFIYKRIGNLSEYSGMSLTEKDKLNSYQYPDDSGNWYAPLQGQPFPYILPIDPISADSGMVLTSTLGTYRGLWPDTGGSANKGDTYQTQVGGISTGRYFTALQSTTVDPVNDGVDWREVVSNQSLGDVTNYQSYSVADMASGITVGGRVIDHSPGQVWLAGNSTYKIQMSPTGIAVTNGLYAMNMNSVSASEFSTLQEAIDFCKTMGQACLDIPYGTYNEQIKIYGNFGPNGLTILGNNATITSNLTGPVVDIDQSITGPAENWRQNIRIYNLNSTADKSVAGSSAARVAAVTDAVQVNAGIDWYGGILRGGASGLILDRCITSSFHGLTIRDSGLAMSSPDISNLLSFHDCRVVNNDRAGSFNNFGLSTIMFNSCEFEANGFSGNATDGIKSLEFTNAGHVVFNGGHMENSNSQYNLWFDGNPTNGASIEAIGVTWISGAGDVCHITRGTLNAVGGQISRGAANNNIYLADSDFAFANLLGGCETTVAGQVQNAAMYGKKGIKVGNVSNTAASSIVQSDGITAIINSNNAFQTLNHSSDTDGNVFRTEVRDSTAGNLTTIGTQVAGSIFRIQGAGSNIYEFTNDGTKRSRPVADNDTTLGDASHRLSVVYAATGTINTSDERNKTEIGEIPSEVLDAWEGVPIRRYKFVDAVADKGDAARWHVGRIAQDVIAAFERHDLDATEWGVLCFDEWPEQVINYPAIKEDVFEEGEKVGERVVAEAWTETIEAGERYGIRYDEAAQLDVALERRDRMKLEEKINTSMNS